MYQYERERGYIFTDSGQRTFIKVRDNVELCLEKSGAVRMLEAISNSGGGSTWELMACVDRMVELGELMEIKGGEDICGQDRVFVGLGKFH